MKPEIEWFVLDELNFFFFLNPLFGSILDVMSN